MGDPAWDELLRILDEELQQLPDGQRAPLLLCYLEGRTQDEAARQLGWSIEHAAPSVRDRPGIASFAHDPAGSDVRSRFVRRCPRTVGVYCPDSCTAASCCWLGKPRRGRGDYSWGVGIGTRSNAYVSFYENREIAYFRIGRQRRRWPVRSGEWGLPGNLKIRRPRKSRPLRWSQLPRHGTKNPLRNRTVRRDQFKEPLPKGALARLGSDRFRHGGWPYGSPAFSADGRQVASASLNAVYVFDVASGRLLQHIQLPDKHHPRVVRFLADGKRIAVGSADWQKSAQMSVYNLADGKASAHSEFQSERSQIFVIDFNADASQVLVEDRFQKVYLWDVKNRREVWSFEHPEASFTLPFTADGKRFILAQSGKSGSPRRFVRQNRGRVPARRSRVPFLL